MISADSLTELVFLVLAGITVLGALIATNAKRLIRAVSGLAVCLIGVAGLYYFLHSPFVALMEMLIYVGAVCVTIVFAVMMAEPFPERHAKISPLSGYLSFAVAILVFVGVAGLGVKTAWKAAGSTVNSGALIEVGKSLLTTNSMVFELISIVLLLAIIGSVALARAGREK
ncbi:MAG: NADH-quinone oxidoreductase subunit J [Deltaproteobacteria bacterium RIFOXYD12_FULL_50_9]|nr:MAG: NADH-quinone oxidoreductase subunit J [Deltaproteobacteria bacterium RIFOXYD12_FULL_50_9]